MKAIMSIKPEYVQLIFEGKKKYEFRRTRLTYAVSEIMLYATKPKGRIVGYIRTDKQISGTPERVWALTKNEAGVSRRDFFKYFGDCTTAYAYRISAVIVFSVQQSPSKDFTIPQSIRYAKPWEEDIFSDMENQNDVILT